MWLNPDKHAILKCLAGVEPRKTCLNRGIRRGKSSVILKNVYHMKHMTMKYRILLNFLPW